MCADVMTLFQSLGLPTELTVMLLAVGGVLVLAYALQGVNLGIIQLPHLQGGKRYTALFIGLAIIASTLVAHAYPFISQAQAHVDLKGWTAERQCTGDWLFHERVSCPDKTQPILAESTNGERCGYDVRQVTVQPDGYKTCRHQEHGIERYVSSNVVSESSGWIGGGHDPGWWCQQMMNNYTAAGGRVTEWGERETREESRRVGLGHVQYKYHCTVTANWSPIYQRKESPECGRKDPVTRTERTPKSCPDPEKVSGYRETQNVSCPFSSTLLARPGDATRYLADRRADMLISEPVCSTCDEYAANFEQRVECLVRTRDLADTLSSPDQVLTQLRMVAAQLRRCPEAARSAPLREGL